VHLRCLTPVTRSELFVGIEPSDPTDPNSAPLARIYGSKAEAEHHTPFAQAFADFMASDDDTTLVF
jgi:hypothetical protein